VPTHHQGTADEKRALDAFIRLSRAVETVAGRVDAEISSYGLTHSQFAALEALYHLGPLCAGELSRKILRSGGNMTLVVDNLVKAGHVERRPDPGDRRRAVLHLTRSGRALMQRVFPGHARFLADLFSELTAKEQEQLGSLCRRLGLGIASR
jgi:MarR family 2-MHQ and catechol resistance regulon transcriptional repressor